MLHNFIEIARATIDIAIAFAKTRTVLLNPYDAASPSRYVLHMHSFINLCHDAASSDTLSGYLEIGPNSRVASFNSLVICNIVGAETTHESR